MRTAYAATNRDDYEVMQASLHPEAEFIPPERGQAGLGFDRVYRATSLAATMPGFHAGRPPHNKGLRYPADPLKVEEIIAVMRAAGDPRTAAAYAA